MLNFYLQKIVSYTPSGVEPASCLNSNHNSFILVHSDNIAETDIEFRTALEAQIKDDLKIPMVLIVLQGGHGTLSMYLPQII
jgi:hypothetical protein